MFERDDGRWVAREDLGVRGGRRDRRDFYGATPEEAMGKRREFRDGLEEGFEAPKRAGKERCSDWLDYWTDNVADVREGSKPDYRSKMRLYVKPRIGGWWLDDLGGDDGIGAVERIYQAMRDQGLAESTILKTHRILSAALAAAVARRKLRMNPCDFVRKPNPAKAGQPRPRPPKMSEAARILRHAQDRPAAARWEVGLNLGLRQGEALGLLRPLIDHDACTMKIGWELQRRTWDHGCDDPGACGARLHRVPCGTPCPRHRHTAHCGGPGCGRKRHECPSWCKRDCARDHPHMYECEPGCARHASSCPLRKGGGLILDIPKSETSRTVIPVPGYVMTRLGEHFERQDQRRARMGTAWTGWGHDCPRRRRRGDDLVCPACSKPFDHNALAFTDQHGRPVDPRDDWGEWAAMLEELGIRHYREHDTRHFAATLLLEQGVDIAIVQAILRHADIRTTKIYTHVSVELGRSAVEAGAAALWGDRATRDAQVRAEAAGLDDELTRLLLGGTDG